MNFWYHFHGSWWFNDEIPFVQAAEVGTEKVIKDHSTIGIIMTTDGTIGDFTRDDYVEAEERVVKELKEYHKPFIIVLNTKTPNSNETRSLASNLTETYGVPVLPIDVINMNEKETFDILREALYEFPVMEVRVEIPDWISVLNKEHYVKKEYIEKIKQSILEVDKLRDVSSITDYFSDCEYIDKASLVSISPQTGVAVVRLDASDDLFNKVLNEMIGVDITKKSQILAMFQDYKESKAEYEQFKTALKMVKTTGYGVANPTLKDMTLDKPEITKQGNRYGIKLKATAPSIHMIRVDVCSTFEPIIGSEMQSKELIDYLMRDSKEDPSSIWRSEIFGRSLDVIVQEGIQSKIAMMPENIRYKLQQTMAKIVNKGSNNLIAIVI